MNKKLSRSERILASFAIALLAGVAAVLVLPDTEGWRAVVGLVVLGVLWLAWPRNRNG